MRLDTTTNIVKGIGSSKENSPRNSVQKMEGKTLENRQERIRVPGIGIAEQLKGKTGAEPVFRTAIQENYLKIRPHFVYQKILLYALIFLSSTSIVNLKVPC